MSILSSVIQRGTRAAQPAAATASTGTLYYVTDEKLVERSTGSAWESYTLSSADALALVTDANLATTDVTTNNATTAKHGFLKKLSNAATDYMDGSGNWSVPAGAGSSAVYTPDMSKRQAFLEITDANDITLVAGKNLVGFGSTTTGGSGIGNNVFDATGAYWDFATTNVSGNTSSWSNNGVAMSRLDWLPKMFFQLALPATITTMRMWFGLSSSISLGTDTPTTTNVKFVGFRYSTDVPDANFMACLEKGDGATSQRTSTGSGLAASTRYDLGFIFTSTTSCSFYLNGTSVLTFNTAGNFFASSQTLFPVFYMETRSAAIRHGQLSKLWLEQK